MADHEPDARPWWETALARELPRLEYHAALLWPSHADDLVQATVEGVMRSMTRGASRSRPESWYHVGRQPKEAEQLHFRRYIRATLRNVRAALIKSEIRQRARADVLEVIERERGPAGPGSTERDFMDAFLDAFAQVWESQPPEVQRLLARGRSRDATAIRTFTGADDQSEEVGPMSAADRMKKSRAMVAFREAVQRELAGKWKVE